MIQRIALGLLLSAIAGPALADYTTRNAINQIVTVKSGDQGGAVLPQVFITDPFGNAITGSNALPFLAAPPSLGGYVPLNVTASSLAIALPTSTSTNPSITIYNSGSKDLFFAQGTASVTATTGSTRLPAGVAITVAATGTYIAGITAGSDTTTLLIYQATGPIYFGGGGSTGGGGGGGGGTSSSFGAAFPGTGTAAGMSQGGSMVPFTGTANNLNVQCANCSGSGVSTADQAAFVAGTSLFAGSGGFFQTVPTANPLTNGQQGVLQVTAQRALFSNLRNASGAEVGVAALPLQVTGANGTFPVSGSVSITGTPSITGTVTANAGTNLNTSALALEAGNLATAVTRLTTINTTLGSPFQAGASIGNTSFGISGTVPSPTTPAGWGIGATGAAVPANASYRGLNVAGNLRGWTGAALGSTFAGHIAIVDGSGNQVTSFGGSNGSVGATASAVPASATFGGMSQSGNLVGFTGTSGNLNVQCANCTGSGASGTDQGAFTAGSSVFAPGGGFFQTTATSNPLTTGQWGAWQMTAQRAGFVNLRNASGTEIGTPTTPLAAGGNVASGASDSGNPVKVGAVYNSSPPTLTTGQRGDLQVDANGNLRVVGTGVTAASTTSGQTFAMIGAAVTTGAPSYTTAQSNFLSLTTGGDLRTVFSNSSIAVSPSTAAAWGIGATAAATPANAHLGGMAQGGNLVAFTGTSGNLNVQCANCSGSGASATDAVAFTAGSSTFAPSGGFFQTTATSNPLTNGQQGFAQMTAQRAFFVNLRDTAGAPIGVASIPLQVSLANTGSNATSVQVGGAGSAGTPSGGLVSVQGVSGMTPFAITAASSAMAAGSQVDLLTMRGTKAPGTAAANSILGGAIYNSAGVTLTDGQQAALQFDSAGNLRVVGTGVGQASTTSGQTGSLVQGAVTTSAPTYTTAQTNPLSLTTAGDLRVVANPGNVQNTTPWLVTLVGNTNSGNMSSLFLQPTASDNHQNVKNGATTVYHIAATNNSATVNYLRLYNAGTGFNGCNSATGIVNQIAIPASTSGAGFVQDITQGMYFSTGLSVCVTSGYAVNDTTNATASAMSITMLFK